MGMGMAGVECLISGRGSKEPSNVKLGYRATRAFILLSVRIMSVVPPSVSGDGTVSMEGLVSSNPRPA